MATQINPKMQKLFEQEKEVLDGTEALLQFTLAEIGRTNYGSVGVGSGQKFEYLNHQQADALRETVAQALDLFRKKRVHYETMLDTILNAPRNVAQSVQPTQANVEIKLLCEISPGTYVENDKPLTYQVTFSAKNMPPVGSKLYSLAPPYHSITINSLSNEVIDWSHQHGVLEEVRVHVEINGYLCSPVEEPHEFNSSIEVLWNSGVSTFIIKPAVSDKEGEEHEKDFAANLKERGMAQAGSWHEKADEEAVDWVLGVAKNRPDLEADARFKEALQTFQTLKKSYGPDTEESLAAREYLLQNLTNQKLWDDFHYIVDKIRIKREH